jgi:protein SFI1
VFIVMPALFQPTRASPPLRLAKPCRVSPAPPSIDLSVISSSTVVVPELKNLTQEDLIFIEAVVQCAGPHATTFPLIFKAYNDVLKDRGMDAGEVRYYGKLLKLGTMKGKNWGEKWEAVKRHHPQVRAFRSQTSSTLNLGIAGALGEQPPNRVITRQVAF